MKARRDVPSYRSWVFPLQTAVRMMEAESAPATFSSPSPPSFLPLTGSGTLTPLFFSRMWLRSAKTVAAMTGDGVWLFSHTLHIPTFPIFVLENEATPLLVGLLSLQRRSSPVPAPSVCCCHLVSARRHPGQGSTFQDLDQRQIKMDRVHILSLQRGHGHASVCVCGGVLAC